MFMERDIFIYQDYLIRKIDTLAFQLSDKPNQTNRILLDTIDKLKTLKDW